MATVCVREDGYLRGLLVAVMAALLHASPAMAQSALPENIPDFCAIDTIRSVGSGAWSNPATWSAGRVPAAGDVVTVTTGTVVSYDVASDASLACVGIDGRLQFATDRSTRLVAGTLMVMPSGELRVGTAAAPVRADVVAEIVVANRAIDTTSDPEQFGTGVLGFGIVTVHGAAKTPTWVRLAQEPRAGATTLVLERPVSGWNVGDRIILPDTRHLRWDEVNGWMRRTGQWEELTIAAISAERTSVTVTSPLRFDHLGARDGAGALRLLPHIGNLQRNIVFRSEVPIGGAGVQGHVLFTHRATIDIRYAAFRDLGRTLAAATGPSNQIGRYPVHIHHLMGPATTPANGYQYTFVGNAVDGGSTNHRRRWGVALHASHYGLIADNVLYNYGGSLLVTEDGSESYNVIERNFAVRSAGTGGREGEGNEGQGFWFRGTNNYVRGNVAADFDSDAAEAAYGFKYFMKYLGTVHYPTAKGQDHTQYTSANGNAMPILEFRDNEVYSAGHGLTYWWLSSLDPSPVANPKESVFEDVRIWHVYNTGVYHYPSSRVRFERLLILGRDPANSACCTRGWHGEDYPANDVRIVNSEIHGMGRGIVPSAAGTGIQVVEDSTLWNQTDISVKTMYYSNGPSRLTPRRIVANNVQFRGGRSISMDWSVTEQSNTTQRDEVLVYGYRGNPSDNFQVFYTQQATQNVAGGLAPCSATRPEVRGLVCSTAASSGPAITWVQPFEGSTAGGTAVRLAGANFASPARVTFGSAAATGVLVNSANEVVATAPAGALGTVNVTVTNPNGQSGSFARGFRYATTTPSCAFTVSPSARNIVAGGGGGSASVTTSDGCAWSAASNASWITLVNTSGGSGSGVVDYTVAPNSTSASRTGTLTIAGWTHTVTQEGQGCSFTVSGTSHTIPSGGGSGTVTVGASAGCTWTAASQASWITVSASGGSGNGSVSFSVPAYTGTTQRSGTLTVAGQTVNVTQQPAPVACSITVSPTRIAMARTAGTGTISVTGGTGCSWSAAASATWITITSGASGSGNGTVAFSVASNGGSGARTGSITVGGQAVTITQARRATGRLVDFDGNGVHDALAYTPDNGAWSTHLSSASGFAAWGSGTWPVGLDVLAGDFNGDGLTDVLLHHSATGAWWKAINNGRGSFDTTTGSGPVNARVMLLDFTADGRSDVFLYTPSTGAWRKGITPSAAPGTFQWHDGTWAAGLEIHEGEWNGDTRPDLLAYNRATGGWFKALNTTNASFVQVVGNSPWSPSLVLTGEDGRRVIR